MARAGQFCKFKIASSRLRVQRSGRYDDEPGERVLVYGHGRGAAGTGCPPEDLTVQTVTQVRAV